MKESIKTMGDPQTCPDNTTIKQIKYSKHKAWEKNLRSAVSSTQVLDTLQRNNSFTSTIISKNAEIDLVSRLHYEGMAQLEERKKRHEEAVMEKLSEVENLARSFSHMPRTSFGGNVRSVVRSTPSRGEYWLRLSDKKMTNPELKPTDEKECTFRPDVSTPNYKPGERDVTTRLFSDAQDRHQNRDASAGPLLTCTRSKSAGPAEQKQLFPTDSINETERSTTPHTGAARAPQIVHNVTERLTNDAKKRYVRTQTNFNNQRDRKLYQQAIKDKKEQMATATKLGRGSNQPQISAHVDPVEGGQERLSRTVPTRATATQVTKRLAEDAAKRLQRQTELQKEKEAQLYNDADPIRGSPDVKALSNSMTEFHQRSLYPVQRRSK